MKKQSLGNSLLLSIFLSFASVNASETELSDYQLSGLSKFFSKDEYLEFQKSVLEEDQSLGKTRVAEGRMITIDTRDQEGCRSFIDTANLEKSICDLDENNPIVSMVVMRDIEHGDFEAKIKFNRFSDKQKALMQDMRALGIMGAGMIGLIYALPESISKWDRSKMRSNFFGKYKKNVAAGPVIDKDDWAINYIGHPVSGAAYYTLVRHQGFSKMESFAFSVCMSTFFWEYGLEALAEVPSIQDLILTPVVGSIMGEIFYQSTKKIEDNDGKFLGSQKVGSVVTVLLNPARSLSNSINNLLDVKFVKDSQFSFVLKHNTNYKSPLIQGDDLPTSSYTGIQYEFSF